MDKLEPELSGLDDKEVTNVLDLLGTDFGDAGIISEVGFFDSKNNPVKIACENNTGFTDESGIQSATIFDTRDQIEKIEPE